MTQGRVSVYGCHVWVLIPGLSTSVPLSASSCACPQVHVSTRVLLGVLGDMQHGVRPSSHIPCLPLSTLLAGLMTARARPCISQVGCHLSVAAFERWRQLTGGLMCSPSLSKLGHSRPIVGTSRPCLLLPKTPPPNTGPTWPSHLFLKE